LRKEALLSEDFHILGASQRASDEASELIFVEFHLLSYEMKDVSRNDSTPL